MASHPDLNAQDQITTLTVAVATTPAAGTVETWTVASSAGYVFDTAHGPFALSGQYRSRVDNEYVTITAAPSGTTLTVVRGAEGSTTATHAVGAALAQVITKGYLDRARDSMPVFNVKYYGAVMDVVRLGDGAMTSGSATLTSASAAFTSADVGKTVQVAGAAAGGNTLATTVSSFTNATTIVLAVNAGATVSGAETYYGTDDTTAFTDAINAAVAGGGGTVWFPGGKAWTGQLTLYSRVHLVGAGDGATVLYLKPAQNVDLIRSDQFASLWGGTSNAGVTQCSVQHLTLDANYPGQNLPISTPAAPTVAASNTGGSLPAATYNYAVSRLTVNGETMISGASANAVVTSGTTGKVTITFPATVTGQTGWAVHGRTYPYNLIATTGLVATYVDLGTITPTTTKAKAAMDASRGLAIYGYGFIIQGVTIRRAAGTGLYTEWSDSSTVADPLMDWMESFVSDLRINSCGGEGYAFNGPHDSVMSRIIIAFCSLSSAFGLDGFHLIGNGYSSLFSQCHVFGNHLNAWHTEGNFFLNDCVGEGATNQLFCEADDAVIVGGTFFSGGAGSSGAGIVIGTSGYQPPNVSLCDVRITGFTTGGTALDLTYAGANFQARNVRIKQASGTAVTGTIPADAAIDIMVSGGATQSSLSQFRGQLISATETSPSAAAGSSAGTSPPAPVLASGSTDTKGSFTFGTGSGSPGTAGYVVLTFGRAYPRTPVVTVAPTNQATTVKQPYINAVSTTSVTIGLGVAGAASQANTVYAAAYHVIG